MINLSQITLSNQSFQILVYLFLTCPYNDQIKKSTIMHGKFYQDKATSIRTKSDLLSLPLLKRTLLVFVVLVKATPLALELCQNRAMRKGNISLDEM